MTNTPATPQPFSAQATAKPLDAPARRLNEYTKPAAIPRICVLHSSAWNALKNKEAEGLSALLARINPQTMFQALLA